MFAWLISLLSSLGMLLSKQLGLTTTEDNKRLESFDDSEDSTPKQESIEAPAEESQGLKEWNELSPSTQILLGIKSRFYPSGFYGDMDPEEAVKRLSRRRYFESRYSFGTSLVETWANEDYSSFLKKWFEELDVADDGTDSIVSILSELVEQSIQDNVKKEEDEIYFNELTEDDWKAVFQRYTWQVMKRHSADAKREHNITRASVGNQRLLRQLTHTEAALKELSTGSKKNRLELDASSDDTISGTDEEAWNKEFSYIEEMR